MTQAVFQVFCLCLAFASVRATAVNYCLYPTGLTNADVSCELNGAIVPSGNLEPQTICTITCNPGYEIPAGADPRTVCVPRLGSILFFPTCTAIVVPVTCPVPVVVNAFEVLCNQNAEGTINVGEGCFINCGPNYEISDETLAFPNCTEAGVVPAPECLLVTDAPTDSPTVGVVSTPATCTIPDDPHARITCPSGGLTLVDGETCNFRCRIGYVISFTGGRTITCDAMGNLSPDPAPTCYDRCPSGKQVVNGLCTRCPFDTYRVENGGFGQCQECPADTMTLGTGSRSIGDCVPRPPAGPTDGTAEPGMGAGGELTSTTAEPTSTVTSSYKKGRKGKNCQNSGQGFTSGAFWFWDSGSDECSNEYSG